MTTTIAYGRLGNQIIRNLAVSLIAEKFNLHVNYVNFSIIDALGIPLFCGIHAYQETISLTEDNYFSVYNSDQLSTNLDPNKSFFQTKEITNFLYRYLHSENIKTNIINKNHFQSRYNNNNDLFIHIRLTDVAHYNPGIRYYVNIIKTIDFDHLYLSTDDFHHTIIREIMTHYPDAKIIYLDEISTFQFASTCKHIILSHGSFSAMIGYLSFFSTVHYPKYEADKIWYGDMFSIEGWIQHALM
jgi:hypothetical protein